jgi:hypothetical protein
MNQLYKEALLGTLRPKQTGNPGEFEIVNRSCLPLLLYEVDAAGRLCGYDTTTETFVEGAPGFPLAAAGGQEHSVTLTDVNDSSCFVLLAARGGAFAAATCKKKVDCHSFSFSSASMIIPNDVGEIMPQPTQQQLIPGNSPTVVVGCGMVASKGGTIVREQYWRLANESYSLAPEEKRTISYTVTDGMESTTSEQKTLAMSLGVEVSGGWGPISASISSNLSSSTSSFQQVVLTMETTSFESHQVDNKYVDDTLLALIWQLVETITIYDATGAAQATVSTALSPAIVKAYKLAELPKLTD